MFIDIGGKLGLTPPYGREEKGSSLICSSLQIAPTLTGKLDILHFASTRHALSPDFLYSIQITSVPYCKIWRRICQKMLNFRNI